MDHSTIGLTGEFYVLAQLAHRGIVASLTLANTKGVDILVSNTKFSRLFKVEVKTTSKVQGRENLFGDALFYRWPMSAKHELLADPANVDRNLVFCFVALKSESEMPRIFVVPSQYVGEYVREQHKHWKRTRRRRVAETSMRTFRIAYHDPLGFENNWRLVNGAEPKRHHLRVTESWCRSK